MTRVFIGLLTVALSGFGLGARAIAADMVTRAPGPVLGWAGAYVGLNAGYAWGKSDLVSAFSCPTGVATCPYSFPVNLASFSDAGTGSIRPDGFTGGFQAGYNWQRGNVVFGVELDFNAFNLRGSRSVSRLVPAGVDMYTLVTGAETDWLFTGRGRLGWAVTPQALLFVTGGVAVTNLEVSNNYVDGQPVTGASRRRETVAGWTLGGGVEYALSRNWSVKGEYLYVSFGDASTEGGIQLVPPTPSPTIMATSADLDAHVARVGLNYKF